MGTQLLLPKKGGTLPIFGPCLLWPNGWMDQDATWYEGRPRPRPHCVTWGPSSPSQKGHSPPIFGPCLLWPNGRPSQLLLSTCIIRSHCSSMYVDAVYCYRPSSVVCPSVCLSVTAVSPATTAEPIDILFGSRTQVGPGNQY